MGNIIKFNEQRLPNSIKSGGFNVGVNNTSTDLTGFYNGITPILSGYTIYIDKVSNGPSIYAPQNDNELVGIVNSLGGSVSTATEALVWINSQSNMTVVNGNYPSIVTDGLVLNLDAGFVSSYPRTGTTWTDLSGSGNTGTLVNGPTFSGDSIVFDGSNDYCDVPFNNRSTTVNTVEMFFRWRTGTGGMFMGFSGYDIWTQSGNLGFNTASSDVWGISSARVTELGLVGISDSNWHHYVFVFSNQVQNNKIYIDGNEEILSQRLGTTNLTTIRSFSSVLRISGWVNSTGYPINGDCGYFRVYNRALTQQEILQNYYAGLQRFIPTDGLVLSLDAQNTNLYATSPTTAYDISGNNNNGTLINGTQYVSDGDGSWSFDGIDDRVVTNFNTLDLSSTWNVWVNRTQSKNVYNMIMGMYLPYFGFRSNGDIHFSININGQKNLYAGVSLSDNVWYFMSFVSSYSDGNTTIMIYLNGVLQNQATYAGQQQTNPQSFMMGTWYSVGTYPFNGKIGQVQIYNRTLTQTEITTIFNATRTRYGV